MRTSGNSILRGSANKQKTSIHTYYYTDTHTHSHIRGAQHWREHWTGWVVWHSTHARAPARDVYTRLFSPISALFYVRARDRAVYTAVISDKCICLRGKCNSFPVPVSHAAAGGTLYAERLKVSRTKKPPMSSSLVLTHSLRIDNVICRFKTVKSHIDKDYLVCIYIYIYGICIYIYIYIDREITSNMWRVRSKSVGSMNYMYVNSNMRRVSQIDKYYIYIYIGR